MKRLLQNTKIQGVYSRILRSITTSKHYIFKFIKKNKNLRIYLVLMSVIVLCASFITLYPARANPLDYAYRYSVYQNINGVDDIKSKLNEEVDKILALGHLAPYRTLYGEITIHYFYNEPYAVVYTLSAAYPHVNASRQNAIKTYLQNEMTSYPIWGDLLPNDQGVYREPDLLVSNERTGNYSGVSISRPRLIGIYALWLYAHNTGDWDYINNNWTSITNFYNSNRSEATSQISGISGAIGMARLALQKPNPDHSMRLTAENDINSALTNLPTNYLTFLRNTENMYKWGGDWDSWTKMEIYTGFHLLYLTPELGRFISDNSTLKEAILNGDINNASAEINNYSVRRGQSFFHQWYMARAQTASRYFGESSLMPPDTRGMIFPAERFIKKLTQMI